MEGYKDNSGFNAVFGSGGGSSPSPTIYRDFGSFFSSVVQTPVPSTSNLVALELIVLSNGISSAPDGTITFTHEGFYMIEVTYQVGHLGTSGSDYAWFWLWYNGANFPLTARQIEIQPTQQQFSIVALQYMVRITDPTTDTINLIWDATSTDVVLDYISNPISSGYPDQASVICNVYQIS